MRQNERNGNERMEKRRINEIRERMRGKNKGRKRNDNVFDFVETSIFNFTLDCST